MKLTNIKKNDSIFAKRGDIMEVLDRLKDYKLNSTVKDHLIYTLEDYKEYLKRIYSLPPKQREVFLKTLSNNEIINNQEMEHEDPFLIQLDLNSSGGLRRTSIDVMVDSIIKNDPLTIKKLIQLHRLVIRGSKDDIERNYRIRDFDVKVSEVSNGVEKVSYIPPAPEDIRAYLRKLFAYIYESGTKEESVLLNSILIHFYIAALQPFGNGNTRLARLIEHGSMFKLTRDVLQKDIKLSSKISSPIIYTSKSHSLTRFDYRDNIANLVNNPTDDSYNRWVNYNLNSVDETLFYNGNVLEKRFNR